VPAEAQPAATPAAPAPAPALPGAPAVAEAPTAAQALAATKEPAVEAQPAVPAVPARVGGTESGARAASARSATPAVPAEPAAPAPAQPAATAAVPAARAEAPATAAPEAAPAPASLPSTPAAPAGVGGVASPPVITQRTAPLHHVPRVVGTLLHVAHERGITHAKISLRPEDLGGIEVRLQSSPAGITAHLVADSPEAARLLAQAGDDLRRSLEARDVNLLSLEVSTSSDQRQGERPGQTPDPDAATGAAGARGDSSGEEAPEAAEPATVSILELPGGLLVDVLA
jgi:flagellar hook-length control protein FliK